MARDAILLTPGPLTTTDRTKRAMLHDWGSWDASFIAVTAEIKKRLLAIVHGEGTHVVVPLQGSGTFSVEAAVASVVPRDGHVLVLDNGAYCKRMGRLSTLMGRRTTVLARREDAPVAAEELEAALANDQSISHIGLIHCETGTGVLNPMQEIADVCDRRGKGLIIDAMSSFAALPIDARAIRFDALVAASGKCLEGVPGMGFVFLRNDVVARAAGNSHSLAMDLHDQHVYMEKTGQWRFTPPTHVVAAFIEALKMHEAEGGVAGRGARYARNRDVMVAGMRELGFETLLSDRWLSPIIVTFFCPAHENFVFSRFYELMKEKGFIIYPGKLTVVDSFRVGCIGRMDEHVMRRVVEAAKQSLKEMGVGTAAPPAHAIAERAKLAA